MRILGAGCLALATMAHAEAPVDGLTFERALELAATRNERTALAQLDVEVADAAVDKARAAFLPVVAGRGDDTWKPFDRTNNLPTGFKHQDITASVTVNQPLIVWSAYPLLDAAKHNLASARAQAFDDRRQLAFDTAKAYLGVLLADEVVKAAEKKLETAKADLDDTTKQAAAELVSKNDVTRAKVSLSGTERELESDRGSLDAAYAQLELQINARVTHTLASPAALLAASEVAPPDADGLVASALAKRPDLVARAESALAAHASASEPHMRFYPTLAAQGSINWDPTGTQSGHDLDASVGLALSWSIYDAGARDADARRLAAQADIAELEKVQLARQIDAQIRSARAQLVGAQASLADAKDALTAADDSVTETAILYKNGLAKAIELVDANEQRFAAAVAFAEAQDNVAQGYLALRQAMGLDPVGGDLR